MRPVAIAGTGRSARGAFAGRSGRGGGDEIIAPQAGLFDARIGQRHDHATLALLAAVERGFRIPQLVNSIQSGGAAYARLQPMLAPALSMADEPQFASFDPNHIIGADEKQPCGNARAPGPVAVSIRNLTFTYPGATHPSLANLSLDVTAGTFVAIGVCVLAVFLGLAEMAWGELFQQPGLILGAAVVLFALGLSLFGSRLLSAYAVDFVLEQQGIVVGIRLFHGGALQVEIGARSRTRRRTFSPSPAATRSVPARSPRSSTQRARRSSNTRPRASRPSR